MKCRACSLPLPPGRALCRCGKWTMLPDTPPLVRLSEVPDEATRRVASSHWSAQLLGGGIAAGSVLLMGGEPGGGKSTFALDLADTCIEETNLDALYLGLEERPSAVRARARRIGCRHLHRLLLPTGEVSKELDILEVLKNPVCLVVLDSLPFLAGQREEEAVSILERLVRFSQRTAVPSLVLDHVTKDRDFAGLKRLEHVVDTTIYLRADQKKNRRTWQTIKNRNGDGFLSREMELGETGLRPKAVEDTDLERIS